MKLLLTSNGIANQSIAKALFDLVGKKPEETSLVFIPTAATIETGDKGWFIDDLNNLYKLGLKSISIVDISAIPESVWLPQIKEADVLFFEGGNTYHLMEWVNKSGLANLLLDLLKTKVYVGASAGSLITNPKIASSISRAVEDVNSNKEYSTTSGLNLIDFYSIPHLNSPHFLKTREENIKKIAENLEKKVYALDDNSALSVVDGSVQVISEGDYLIFN